MRNNIINKYINTVTKNMGSKQREEVDRELNAHILDSADALAETKNVPVDDTIIQEVISRMGPAEDLATMYPKERGSSDKLKNALKYMARSLVIFIVASTIIGIVLQVIFGDVSLYSFIMVAFIVYMVLMVIHYIRNKFLPNYLMDK